MAVARKKCIISTSATYIWHTCEKDKKKKSSQQKIELTNNGEKEHISISSLKKSLSLHKTVNSKLTFKAIKISLEK